MSTIVKNQEELKEHMGPGITIVDFYADWCGPCKALSPTLDSLSDQNEQVKVVKVNVDESRDLATSFNIRGIPALFFFKDGEEKGTATGNLSLADLQKKVDELA